MISTDKNNYTPLLKGGLKYDQVSTSFWQALIEKNTYDACFWAFVFSQNGYHKYVFRKLEIFANRIIGNKDPFASITIHTLKDNYDYCTLKANRNTKLGLSFIYQAIMYITNDDKQPLYYHEAILGNYFTMNFPKLLTTKTSNDKEDI